MLEFVTIFLPLLAVPLTAPIALVSIRCIRHSADRAGAGRNTPVMDVTGESVAESS